MYTNLCRAHDVVQRGFVEMRKRIFKIGEWFVLQLAVVERLCSGNASTVLAVHCGEAREMGRQGCHRVSVEGSEQVLTQGAR